jgi:predicted kinase
MEMNLFTGIPGSGKSTFYQQNFFHTHLRVSLDQLRTRNRESRLLHYCFDTKMRLVVDNTNVTREDRRNYIRLARQYGYRINGFYFYSDLNECLQRNAARSGRQKIEEKGVIAKYRQLQRPGLQEGYDQLFLVRLLGGNFLVTEWDEDTALKME